MIVELENVVMIELVHDFDFKFYLLNEIMLNDFLLVDDFDGEHVFGYFVANFVNFTKPTNSDVAVRDRLKVIFTAFSLLPSHYRRRQEQDSALDVVNLVFELGRYLNGCDDNFLFLFAHTFQLYLNLNLV